MADILENPVDLIDDAYEQEIQVEQEMIEVVAYRSYNRLDDKPQINGVELVGNKTSSDLGITAQIESAVNSEAQARAQADNTLQGKIDTEKLARQQADSTLQGNIDAEETARKAADKDIQDVLDGETLARQNADTALGGRIDTEIHDRQVADIALQGQIDAITSKSDVVDVVATYADLQAYDTQHLGDNDVIKVLDDETHEDALTYYRWSTTTQTWTYIGQESPYYSKSQTDTLLLGKQNTIDSSHKLSADLVDDTSTTNKFVTASDITNWNAKQDALTAGTGIDITGGVISTPAIVPEVVAELPTTGAEGKLYLTPKAHTTSTATGNPIEATVTEQAGQLESFQLDGDTFQQSYTGKNLLDIQDNLRASDSGLNFSFSNNELTVSGTPTRGWANVTSNINVSLPAGQYTLSLSKQLTYRVYLHIVYTDSTSSDSFITNAGQTSTTITLAKDVSTIRLDFSMMTTGVAIDESFNLQLEAGSTATSFEPFVGGQPSPNPEYPQSIQTVTGEQTVTIASKNLFSGQNLTEDSRVSTSNGVTYGREGYEVSDYIEVEPSTKYALTCGNVQSGSYFSWYDSTKTYISGSGWQNKTSKTSPANASYIRFDFLASEVGIVQFEKGSASSYVPYSNVSYPLDLGSIELCKLGTYKDYIYKDGEDWKVHKATNSITYDGTNYGFTSRSSSSVSGKYRFTLDGSETEMSNAESSSGAYFIGVCDKLISGTRNNTFVANRNVVAPRAETTYGNVGVVYAEDIAEMTQEQANTWLTTHNLTVKYALATPTDTTITDTTLIAQLEAIRTALLENGTNTITNTATGTNLAGDMEIGYFGFNPTNRYDKFIWLNLNNNYEQIGGE